MTEFTDKEMADFATPTWVDGVASTPIDEMAIMVAEDPSVLTTLIGALRHARAEIGGLQQDLDMATGPRCTSCGNPIDPDVCWCGDGPSDKHHDETHGFIPMGCDCCRADRDWQKMACALRETLHIEHKTRLSLTPEEVEVLEWLRGLASPSPMFDHCRHDPHVAEHVANCDRAIATLDRLLAAAQERKP